MSALLQNLDARERLAPQELERRTAAGREMVEGLLEAETLHRKEAVSAADDGVGLGSGDRGGHAARSGGERLPLEDAHRAVPQDRVRVRDRARKLLHGAGSDVEALAAFRDRVRRNGGALGVDGDVRGGNDVLRKLDQHAALLRLLAGAPDVVETVGLDEAVADLSSV